MAQQSSRFVTALQFQQETEAQAHERIWKILAATEAFFVCCCGDKTKAFEELYRSSYNLVLHGHGHLLYVAIEDQLSSFLCHTRERRDNRYARVSCIMSLKKR